MRSKLLVGALTVVLWAAGGAQAQFTQDPNDFGVADTVDMIFTVTPDYTTGQMNCQVDLWVFNDSNSLIGCSMGYGWENANMQMDSAVGTPLVVTGFDLGTFYYEDNDINLTNANLRFIFGGALLFGPGVVGAPNRQLWASYYFTLSDWGICDSVAVDTLTFSPGSVYKLVSVGNLSYEPYFTGRIVHKDTACVVQANLVLSTDSLHFDAVEGAPSPDPQSFTVISDGDPLNFTLTESIPWLVFSPTSGITTQAINVLPSTSGLSVGTYHDSVRIESAEAANSPVWLKVGLIVETPPPEIATDPDAFFFNAVAGGDNPDPKTLTITNVGGPTLNWTVSNSESWLSLAPTGGTDSGDVTVSVDITGLAFDDYEDVIIVSDPNAANDSVEVPVYLSVGSDLPIIEVDSAFNFVVVPTGTREVDPRTILVRNGGAGTMNFWLEEDSPRLFELTPDSGTAPQEVEVTFKLTGGSAGDDFFDTLWVYSNEAINSPFPVVFQFHLVDNPALMVLSEDTAHLVLYECEMGARVPNPTFQVLIDNLGGDDPMNFILVWESELFDVTVLDYTAPSTMTIWSNFLDLPVGDYWDTIIVYAQTAINPLDTVIVWYEVREPDDPPAIWLSKDHYTIPAQENSGEIPPTAFEIHNEFGGCLDWYIVETVPWMFPTDTAGTTPSALGLGANADGFLFGEYPDSFYVHAPEATNNPRKVTVLFRVWRFHGDNDYSSEINILDLVYFVDWLFLDGPDPEPWIFVGDLNCDRMLNIEDLTYFVAYMFEYGPIPCGNPY